MAISCPKCEFLNPYGAEICGDCGYILGVETDTPGEKDKLSPEPKINGSDLSSKSGELSHEGNASSLEGSDLSLVGKGSLTEINEEIKKDFMKDKENPGLSETKPILTEVHERLPEISFLSKIKRERASLPIQMLSGILLAFGLILIVASILLFKAENLFIAFFPSLASFTRHDHSAYLFFLLLIGSGCYTMVVAHGLSHLKKWGINAYISWVLIQIVMEILARIFYPDLGISYSPVVLVELLIIPFLWKSKYRFFY